jgi:Uma2 family endonuclease
MAAPAAPHLLTAEEFFLLPDADDDSRMELIDGRVCMTPPPGGIHGRFEPRMWQFLDRFVRERQLGEVFIENGYTLRRDPDHVLAPDVSFVKAARIPASGPPRGYFEGAPDLAVEIVSKSNRAAELLRKVGDYLDAGAARVWLVYPEQRRVVVYRAGGEVRTLHIGETLSSDDAGFATDGFSLALDELFA